jgi:hypothetical protein
MVRKNDNWAYKELLKTANLHKSNSRNTQTNFNPISQNNFDINYYVKKYKLDIYGTSRSFLHNYLAVLYDVSFLVSYSAFMREKIKYDSNLFGLFKSVDYDKTFTNLFREKFYGYGACLNLIVIIFTNLKNLNVYICQKSGLSDKFMSNFYDMKLQFDECEKLYNDCVNLKLNPSHGNLKSTLVKFNNEFLKLAKLFENLTGEYNYMNHILKDVRSLDTENVNKEMKLAA